MSEISKALDKSHEVTVIRKSGGHRLRDLDIVRSKANRRLTFIILGGCACLTAIGSILLPSSSEEHALHEKVIAPIIQKAAAVPDAALYEELNNLVVKVLAPGASPRILTDKGVYVVNQEFLPGLYLLEVDTTSLVAVDKNGATYRKNF